MNEEEIFVLIRYRLEQAVSSRDDARFLLQGKRTPRIFTTYSISARSPTTRCLSR